MGSSMEVFFSSAIGPQLFMYFASGLSVSDSLKLIASLTDPK
jgi:hypothetical protein